MIPVIINNRDLLTWPKAMVSRIKKYDNVGEIVILDNGSTYEPLLEWYETRPCTIFKAPNLGHAAPWNVGLVGFIENNKKYVVTDSDLGLESTPDNTLTFLEKELDKRPDFKKIGLGLDWKIVPKESPYYQHVQSYEKNRWNSSIVLDGVIHPGIPIDTTFALYNVDHYFIGGASLGTPFLARHYPWELIKPEEDAEFKYYYDHANLSSSYKSMVKM